MKYARRWGLVGTAALAALFLLDPRPLVLFHKHVLDLELALTPRVTAADHVVIVDIDEPSLAAIGQWPWPRTQIAQLISRLTEDGAAAIALDMKFPEADRTGPEGDAALATAIAAGPVILGQETAPLPSPAAGPKADLIVKGGTLSDHSLNFPGAYRNLPSFENAASGLGYYSLSPEEDGVVRRIPMVLTANGQPGFALSIEALRVASGQRRLAVTLAPDGITKIGIGSLSVPTDGEGRIWLGVVKASTATRISAAKFLSGAVPQARIEGRIALIGTSAQDLNDLKITPLADRVPGVDIHAAAIEAIIGEFVPTRPAYAMPLELLIFIVAAIALSLTIPMLGALGAGLLTIVSGVVACAIGMICATRGVLVDGATPALGLFVLGAGLNVVHWSAEEKRRRFLRQAFGQYLAPTMIERLLRDPGGLKLGGEVRIVTILFADIRDFTALAERHAQDPAKLTVAMNQVFTAMADAVLAEEGTIDKLVGDSLIAFWNAPFEQKDHARRAARAGLAMVDAVARLPGLEMRIGVGINTGACFVGNMGAAQRFDYTALGDPVNIAARLEAETKETGVPILLGPETAAALGADAVSKGRVLLRGRAETIEIFALKA